MKKILLCAFTVFALHTTLYSFAQNQDLSQQDLPDKTPPAAKQNFVYKVAVESKSRSTPVDVNESVGLINNTPKEKTSPNPIVTRTTDSAAANQPSLGTAAASAKSTIDKSQLLDVGGNVISRTNDLVTTLLGTGKTASLMFDDEETSNIERAINSFKNEQTFVFGQDSNSLDGKKKQTKGARGEDENEKSYIYLASIIYYTNKDWAVWINNSKVTSDNNKNSKELFVKEIYPDRAKIIWSLSISKWKILSGQKSEDATPKLNAKNNVEIEFTLKPNQTFILGSGRVVEGRAVINLVKEKSPASQKK